jgi:hypothetical protein
MIPGRRADKIGYVQNPVAMSGVGKIFFGFHVTATHLPQVGVAGCVLKKLY